MKTQEEKLTLEQVNNLPKVETLSKMLYELTEEELKQVFGGVADGMQMAPEAKPVEVR